jgi:hypothetical protein
VPIDAHCRRSAPQDSEKNNTRYSSQNDLGTTINLQQKKGQSERQE